MSELKEGILPLWKEKGMTSFDCVFKIRRMLGIKKVGHAGTLDPEVDGVLPLAVGKATRVLEFMLESDKTYIGEVTLGYSTSTEDAAGEVIEKKPVESELSEAAIDGVLHSFQGEIEQTPPMFSAVKIAGKRLYEYAFEGIEVERPSRKVTIFEIKRTSAVNYNSIEKTASFTFEVSCSKGTYIRTLAVDIGEKLKYPAHMSKLTRIQSGNIRADQAFTLSEVETAISNGTINQLLLPIEVALEGFGKLEITEDIWKRVKNGSLLNTTDINAPEYPILLTYQNQAVALYEKHSTKLDKIKPKKVFRTEL